MGIRHHMMADAVFHGHAEFLRRVAWIAPQLALAWPGLRHASIGAHVLVEMQLDRWILRAEPDRAEDYYACFTGATMTRAARLTTCDEDSFASLRALLERFMSSGFLRDYVLADRLAERFVGTLLCTPFASRTAPCLPALCGLVEETSEPLGAGSAQLLEDVRAGADRRTAQA
jgi:hypothetical protein